MLLQNLQFSSFLLRCRIHYAPRKWRLNAQNWCEHVAPVTFWLGNVLRAAACTFWTAQLPKVFREGSLFLPFGFQMCFAPQFLIYYPARWLRTAVASLLYFLTLWSPKTLDKHSVSRLYLLLQSFLILFDPFRSFSRNVIFCLLTLSPLTFPAPVAASVHVLEIRLQFFSVNYVFSFLWKHPRHRAELEERNSRIDAGIVWMDEFRKFKQIRYCRGQGQDRSWILDVLTGQVCPCRSQVHMGTDGPAFKQFVVEKNWTSMQVLKTPIPTQTPCPRPPMGQKTRPSCNSFEGS